MVWLEENQMLPRPVQSFLNYIKIQGFMKWFHDSKKHNYVLLKLLNV